MSLRFFADHCVPTSVARALTQAGHTVFLLRDYIPINSPDEHVIATAQEMDTILVSLDGDFSNIISYPPSWYKGILALQIRNHPEIIPQLMEGLARYLAAHDAMTHYAGKLLLVEVHRIRSRG